MTRTRTVGRLAIGATLGVLLTLGATQAWQVTAAPGDTDTTFVSLTPCRLMDTRPGAAPLSGKKTPLAAGVGNIHTQQVTGNVGSCVGIPSNAVAISMNVTAVNPSTSSFLTVFPADQPLPNASNLNWIAGQAATPNKVDVRLSPDGKIKLFHETGTVDVIADVVGYYTPSSLTELNQRLAAVEAQLATKRPVAAYASAVDQVVFPTPVAPDVNLQLPASQMLTLTITAPTAGKVSITAHATAKSGVGGEARLVCQITNNPASTTIHAGEILGIASPSTANSQPSLGTNRVFDVVAGDNTFDLMCAATGSAPNTIHYRSMSALFTPAS